MDGELSTDQDSYHLTCGTQSSTLTTIRGRQQGVSPDKPTPLRQPQSTCQDTHFEMHWSTLIRPSCPEQRFSISTPQIPSLQLSAPCLGLITTTSIQLSPRAQGHSHGRHLLNRSHPTKQGTSTMYHVRHCTQDPRSTLQQDLVNTVPADHSTQERRETSNQTGTVQCYAIVDK